MTPAHFAYAGMAGMVGGTTGAVITGTIMIFEMTRDYTVIMPVIVTVAIATAVRNALSPATIYTLKLVRRGDVVPQGLLARMDDRDCRHAMSADFVTVSQAQLAEDNATVAALRRGKVVVISGPDNRIRSILDERSRTEAGEGPLALEGGTHIVVSPETPLRTVLRALGDAGGARIAVVARKTADGSQEVLGVITEREVARLSYAAARVSD
jgi:CIC family chloride channel protein